MKLLRSKRVMGSVVLLVLAVLVFVALRDDGERPLQIGSKKFTEGVILGDILTLLVESEEQPARHRSQLGGTRIVFDALTNGGIDAYVEYSGTLLRDILRTEARGSLAEIRQALEEMGVRMGPTLGFNNSYGLGMRRARAAELGIETISDLKKHPSLVLGFSHEFIERGDGWPGLRRRYELPQQNVKGLDHDLAYGAVSSGSVDVLDVYTTDAKIISNDLVTLKDDQSFFPLYDAVILYRVGLETSHPDIVQSFEVLRDRISEEQMMRLNAGVAVDKRTSESVAASFLETELDRFVEVQATSRTSRLIKHTKEHLILVGVSLLIAIVLGLVLGIVAARTGVFGQALIGIVSAAQTIPGLALLALLVPWLQIGWKPTVVALVIYSLLPIVRNTHAGLTNIPRALKESVEVLGLSPRSRLFQVELPLAAPSIFAGIKTAAVWNVGLAALGALVGAGGYGQPILAGIRRADPPLILEGAIPAIVLALLMQLLFEGIERMVVSPGLRARTR